MKFSVNENGRLMVVCPGCAQYVILPEIVSGSARCPACKYEFAYHLPALRPLIGGANIPPVDGGTQRGQDLPVDMAAQERGIPATSHTQYRWTPQDLDNLTRLYSEGGLPAACQALDHKFSRTAIQSRAYKLGLRSGINHTGPRFSWTPAEKAILIATWPSKNNTEIHALLGRHSFMSISNMAHHLGLRKKRGDRQPRNLAEYLATRSNTPPVDGGTQRGQVPPVDGRAQGGQEIHLPLRLVLPDKLQNGRVIRLHCTIEITPEVA